MANPSPRIGFTGVCSGSRNHVNADDPIMLKTIITVPHTTEHGRQVARRASGEYGNQD